MTGLAIEARGLVHIYRLRGQDVVALTRVDLDLAPGQMIGLLGPSGAGKSTLLRLLAGLQRPSAGHLRVGTQDLGSISPAALNQLRARQIGVMLQGGPTNLLPYATPGQNVAFAQVPARRFGDGADLLPPAGVLDLVGLGSDVDRPLPDLNPGQLQRLAVAVSFAASPGLLLVDEPTSQLDHRYRDEVLSAITGLNAANGTTVVAVTHDPAVAASFGRTVTIRDGRIGAEGRGGEEFAVVGSDGSLQLPPHARDRVAPGTLLRIDVRLDTDGLITLQPVDPNDLGDGPR